MKSHRSAISSIALLLLLFAGIGCDRNSKSFNSGYDKDALMDGNKRRMAFESKMIDRYLEERDLEMFKTETGIRYAIYHGGGSDSARHGAMVGISYRIYLLDSTLVEDRYAKTERFRVGYDDVTSGLHEAVGLLARGDSARIIIPSYMAYGLTGKAPLIPSNAPLLYDLCLVEVE